MPTRTLSRREVLGCAAGAAAASRLDGAEEGKRDGPGFLHRGYLGWITDLATNPDPAAEWPSMRLDEQLLKDYHRRSALCRGWGTTRQPFGGSMCRVPGPLRSATQCVRRAERWWRTPGLGSRVQHRIHTGLGVYSWGFDEIIRANPKLSRGNPHAMCASVPESWKWMQRVTDYVFERFPIDGASLQSADQGRCSCEDCRRYTNAEYHARLNIKVGEYIRDRWPGKTVAINGWGMNFADPKTFDPLARMSRAADYIIDVSDSSSAQGPGARQRLAQGLKCDFGTIGGPQVNRRSTGSATAGSCPPRAARANTLPRCTATGAAHANISFTYWRTPATKSRFGWRESCYGIRSRTGGNISVAPSRSFMARRNGRPWMTS